MFLIFIILHNLSLDNFNKQCQQRGIVHSGGNDSLLGTNEDGGGVGEMGCHMPQYLFIHNTYLLLDGMT